MTKPLSMTPSAIKKREQRAAAKSITTLYIGGVNITEKRKHEANFVGPIAPNMSQAAADAVVAAPGKPQEAQEPTPVVDQAPSSEMFVMVVGHAFIAGKGTDKPKKDSLWGILNDAGVLVKFFGRRGGALRFKLADSRQEAMELYKLKLAGKDVKKLAHVDLTPSKQRQLLGADWPASLFAKYKDAKTHNAVDGRSTRLVPSSNLGS